MITLSDNDAAKLADLVCDNFEDGLIEAAEHDYFVSILTRDGACN